MQATPRQPSLGQGRRLIGDHVELWDPADKTPNVSAFTFQDFAASSASVPRPWVQIEYGSTPAEGFAQVRPLFLAIALSDQPWVYTK